MGGLAYGLQFAIMTFLGLAGGYWLDQHKFLPSPLGTIGGLFGGAVLGMYVLAKALSKK
jgi:hypothetical protein